MIGLKEEEEPQPDLTSAGNPSETRPSNLVTKILTTFEIDYSTLIYYNDFERTF